MNQIVGIPAYAQVASGIAARIAAGEWKTHLPREAELATVFGVSPATVRNALMLMRERGLVERKRGRGNGTSVRQDVWSLPASAARLGNIVGPFTVSGLPVYELYEDGKVVWAFTDDTLRDWLAPVAAAAADVVAFLDRRRVRPVSQ